MYWSALELDSVCRHKCVSICQEIGIWGERKSTDLSLYYHRKHFWSQVVQWLCWKINLILHHWHWFWFFFSFLFSSPSPVGYMIKGQQKDLSAPILVFSVPPSWYTEAGAESRSPGGVLSAVRAPDGADRSSCLASPCWRRIMDLWL